MSHIYHRGSGNRRAAMDAYKETYDKARQDVYDTLVRARMHKVAMQAGETEIFRDGQWTTNEAAYRGLLAIAKTRLSWYRRQRKLYWESIK